MQSFLILVVFLCLAYSIVARAAITLNCGENSVSVQWSEVVSQIDPFLLRLGSCPPSRASVNAQGSEAVFHAEFGACDIRRLVTMGGIVFETEITSVAETVSYPVACVFERPKEWSPPLYDPLAFQTYGQGGLAFHLTLMNDDFSGLATSTTFSLGSTIPISASVEQLGHQPLILFLDECWATTTPILSPESLIHPLITNGGCLVDSKKTNSRFLPRNQLSEIRLGLQAFRFATGQDIYLHCRLVAWDPQALDSSKKACQYDSASSQWVLLEDPSQSSLCSCCDTSCQGTKKREIKAGSSAISMLGPLVITK